MCAARRDDPRDVLLRRGEGRARVRAARLVGREVGLLGAAVHAPADPSRPGQVLDQVAPELHGEVRGDAEGEAARVMRASTVDAREDERLRAG